MQLGGVAPLVDASAHRRFPGPVRRGSRARSGAVAPAPQRLGKRGCGLSPCVTNERRACDGCLGVVARSACFPPEPPRTANRPLSRESALIRGARRLRQSAGVVKHSIHVTHDLRRDANAELSRPNAESCRPRSRPLRGPLNALAPIPSDMRILAAQGTKDTGASAFNSRTSHKYLVSHARESWTADELRCVGEGDTESRRDEHRGHTWPHPIASFATTARAERLRAQDRPATLLWPVGPPTRVLAHARHGI